MENVGLLVSKAEDIMVGTLKHEYQKAFYLLLPFHYKKDQRSLFP